MPLTAATAAPPFLTVRQLPPEEFGRLADLPFATHGIPDPAGAAVLVAETPEGEIVGLWAAMTAIHLDGLWIAPTYRRSSHVGGRLLRGMRALLASLDIPRAVTLVESDEVLLLALKAGFQRVRGDLMLLDLTTPAPPAGGD